MKRDKENSPAGTAATLLWPFTVPYGIAARFKNFAYDRHWVHPRELSSPVVSIGNLSVGGTGKSPLVLLLADLLSQRGWSVDVLSRGYGRSDKNVARVDPSGTADKFGDEPLLMARHGLRVYVGADRFDAGKLAEQDGSTGPAKAGKLHILDDGFQHRKLARDVDIVLLQRADMDGQLLPAGRLREPLDGLRRADFCVLRAEDIDLSEPVLQRMERRGQPSDSHHIWIVERRTTLPPDTSSIRNALAFCAIGDAMGFFDGLRRSGVTLRSTLAFRDHHVFNEADISRLKTQARESRATSFVTTEKDSVRLSPQLRAQLEEAGGLVIAGLELSLQQQDRCILEFESLLQERLQLRPLNVR